MLPGIGPLAGISLLLPVTLRARRHQGDRDARRHLLRLAIRTADHLDPECASRASLFGDDLHRRLCHGAKGPRWRGALHRRGRLVHRRARSAWSAHGGGPRRSRALRCGSDRPNTRAAGARPDLSSRYSSSTSLVRTSLMASFGLLLGMIGIDVLTGHFRYSFDIPSLATASHRAGGVGLSGLGEILATPSKHRRDNVVSPTTQGVASPPVRNGVSRPCRSRAAACLGFLIGIVPGSAHIISSFLSYALEKRLSKTPEEFGIRRGRRRCRSGIGQQRGPRPAPLCRCWRSACRPARLTAVLMAGAAHSRRAPGPLVGERSSGCVLGLHRVDAMSRNLIAARAQPAAGRAVRECAADSLRLSPIR